MEIYPLLSFTFVLWCFMSVAASAETPHAIEAVEGSDVRIPCPQFREIQHPQRIRLVLWFKDNDTEPIASFDGRRRTQVVGAPADLSGNTADLQLTRVTSAHSGRYRCRVDAEDVPTLVSWVTLTVHDAPAIPSLKIFSRNRDEVDVTEISAVEYSTIELMCHLTNGGGQVWNIAWLIRRPTAQGGEVLNSETDRNDPSKQRLQYNVTRADDSAALVCTAGTVTGEKLSAEVTLQITYGPDSASVRCEPDPAVAGGEVMCSCHVTPAQLQYKVTWLWGAKLVTNGAQQTPSDVAPRRLTGPTSGHPPDVTASHQLTMVTSRDDDGRGVACVAVNGVSGQERQATATLTVLYAPHVILSGPTSELVEGEDAHFSCFVRAQPPAQFTHWLHNDRQLESSDRVVAGPQLLIVKNLTPKDTGRYSCYANNTQGAGVSDTVDLQLQYAPVCGSETVPRLHAAPYRATFVTCSVRARPPPTQFQWQLQPADAGETRTLHRSAHSDEGQSSVLQWTPGTDADYGRLLCWATNTLGRQQRPCAFDLAPPVPPNAVQNCTVSTSDESITCVPGTDGGLTSWYSLWLYGPGDKLTGNWTEDQPSFTLPMSTLPAGEYRAEVVAESAAGRAEPVQLRFSPRPSVGPHTDESQQLPFNSWVLAGAIFSLLSVVALIIMSVHVRCHCTPISDVGSCRGSPGTGLTRQRSHPHQQPIYAEVQRRHSSLQSGPGHGDCEAPLAPRQRSTSRSRSPRPPGYSTSDRDGPTAAESDAHSREQYKQYNTLPKPARGGRGRSSEGAICTPPGCTGEQGSDNPQQPPHRPRTHSATVHRCRSLPVPPPVVVGRVRGRSVQPSDVPPSWAHATYTQPLAPNSEDHRTDTEPVVRVHLRPPTPPSTASTVDDDEPVEDASTQAKSQDDAVAAGGTPDRHRPHRSDSH